MFERLATFWTPYHGCPMQTFVKHTFFFWGADVGRFVKPRNSKSRVSVSDLKETIQLKETGIWNCSILHPDRQELKKIRFLSISTSVRVTSQTQYKVGMQRLMRTPAVCFKRFSLCSDSPHQWCCLWASWTKTGKDTSEIDVLHLLHETSWNQIQNHGIYPEWRIKGFLTWDLSFWANSQIRPSLSSGP